MSNGQSLLVLKKSNTFLYFLFFFSEEPGNFYCMEDRYNFIMLCIYYYPDNTLGKNELNLEKEQV